MARISALPISFAFCIAVASLVTGTARAKEVGFGFVLLYSGGAATFGGLVAEGCADPAPNQPHL